MMLHGACGISTLLVLHPQVVNLVSVNGEHGSLGGARHDVRLCSRHGEQQYIISVKGGV